MKIQFLSVAVTLLLCTAVNAQTFHLGAKAGANLNKISGKSFSDQFTYGYQAGAFAEIGLTKKFSIQPEVLFSQISSDTSSQFKSVYTNLSANKASNIKLNYLSIPLLLSYKLAPFISLQAGPQFGILLNKDQTVLNNGKNAFKQGDLSMLAGLQVKIGSIRVYGRYAIGLTNINDIDKQENWKSQTIQVGVGFAIL